MQEELGRFHHLGLACRTFGEEYDGLAALGYRAESEPIADPLQKVRVQFFTCALSGAGPRIELVEPLEEGSPVSGWLKRGAKLYHLAYEVPGLEKTLQSLEEQGFAQISEPLPAVAFGMRRILFVISPSRYLVELIEEEKT